MQAHAEIVRILHISNLSSATDGSFESGAVEPQALDGSAPVSASAGSSQTDNKVDLQAGPVIYGPLDPSNFALGTILSPADNAEDPQPSDEPPLLDCDMEVIEVINVFFTFHFQVKDFSLGKHSLPPSLSLITSLSERTALLHSTGKTTATASVP